MIDAKRETEDPYGFLEKYEKVLSGISMETPEDERQAWFTFLDMLCLSAIYQREQRPEELLDRVGALPGDAVLMQSLFPREEVFFPALERIRGIYDDLVAGEMLDEKERLPISSLLRRASLSHLEFLAFLLAYGFSVNRKYQRIFGILQGEKEGEACPTIGLCIDLSRLYLTDEEREMGILYSQDSFLNAYLLTEETDPRRDKSPILRALLLRPLALSVLMGEKNPMGQLSAVAEILSEADDSDYVCFPEVEREILSVMRSMDFREKKGIIELCGEAGSGRRFQLRLLSWDLRRPVVAADLRKILLLEGKLQRSLASDLILKAVLEGALIYLYGAGEIRGDFPGMYFLSELQSVLPLIFLGTEKPISEATAEGFRGTVYRIGVPEAGLSAQQTLWTTFARAEGAVFSEEVDLSGLVSRFSMSPGRIREALLNAESAAGGEEEGCLITLENLERQIRRICAVQFQETATLLKSPFVWEDLKVDERAEVMLRRVCDRIRYRKTVNGDFGFEKKLPYGRGVSLVLYGPPGTGKTMAAQVLAKELGLDIYRIDLSQISSKYIGETEKNLGAVFDAARNSNAILFFDEADSLFSKRTEVSSSHDRYANAETSYLLQKIEEYPGVSILATNNMQNFDAAFKRRITYIIPLEEPSEETRLLLWQNAFPENTPLSPEIDFRLLAKALNLTGSNIRSVSVNAAYRAAAEHREINYQDLVEAVDAECMKVGRMGVGTELQQAIIRGYREE